MAEKILSPLFDGGGNGGKFPDIRGRAEKFGGKLLTEECNWVVVLRQYRPHAFVGRVSFDDEGNGEIRQAEDWGAT